MLLRLEALLRHKKSKSFYAERLGITVQLTPIGTNQALVVKSVSLKEIVIENKSKTAKNINCYYYIQGERKDIPKIDVEY
jgi:hypothetical protein